MRQPVAVEGHTLLDFQPQIETCILRNGSPIILLDAFIGKAKKPTDGELAADLAPARAPRDQLVAGLANDGVDIQEWNSCSPKEGWSLRLNHKDGKIVYMSLSRGSFTGSFALGGKAVKAARQGGLPQKVIKISDRAKRYSEGPALRVDVKGPEDVAVVKKLAAAKLGN